MTTGKNIFVTFVTTFRVRQNGHSDKVTDNQVTMDTPFENEWFLYSAKSYNEYLHLARYKV